MTRRKKNNRLARSRDDRLPKTIGYDGEVANYIEGRNAPNGTGKDAARKIIREVKGYPDFPGRHLLNCPCDACETHRNRQSFRGWGGYGGHGSRGGFSLYGGQVGYGSHSGYASYVGWNGIAASISNSQFGGVGSAGASDYDPRDHDRRYLADTGGCIYIDLNHIEVCLPETRTHFWTEAARL